MGDAVTAAALRERFDGMTDGTLGVEEELMLLDPDTLNLLPAAARVHAELGERVSLRTELPAAQVETASPVCDSIDQAARALGDGRRELAGGTRGWARLAASGTHPFAAAEGVLREDPKYDALKAAFPWALPQQLTAPSASARSRPSAVRTASSPGWPTRSCHEGQRRRADFRPASV
jgi:carboxylate-amine ligase